MKLFRNWLRGLFPSTKGPKKYTFGIRTTQQHIEEYNYEIEAESQDAAFRKLVNMFYGDQSNTEIKSEHRTGVGVCTISTNMPLWFARLSEGSPHKGDRDKLFKYASKNHIKLRVR